MSSIDHRNHCGESLLPNSHGNDVPIILIADNNVPAVRHKLAAGMQTDHQLVSASTGYEALQRFHERRPDLVLLDVELTGIPSWEVCRYLLAKTRVPIVFLADSHHEDDAIRALGLGAVDYVTRTTPSEILQARTRAALRRTAAHPSGSQPRGYKDDYLQIDLDAQEVLVKRTPVPLTMTEYGLLAYLLKKAGQICSKEQLLLQIWGEGYENSLHYVHLYMGRLRNKIEEAAHKRKYLISVYGKGYYFRPNEFGPTKAAS